MQTTLSKTKWPLIALALALCSAFSGCETRETKIVQAEASPTAKSSGFTIVRVRNDRSYTVAFVLTEDSTGRRYLLNSEGGTPLEIAASN